MSKEQNLTQEQLKAVVHYDPSTGLFTWLSTLGGVCVGQVAGNGNSNGYRVLGWNGRKYRQHRLAWLYVHGAWPKGTIDHMDGDRCNNRIGNLRDVSQRINMQNQRKPTKANTSGALGVYWSANRGGYMASVSVKPKKYRRGPYRTIERAQDAYLDLKRKHHEGCTL